MQFPLLRATSYRTIHLPKQGDKRLPVDQHVIDKSHISIPIKGNTTSLTAEVLMKAFKHRHRAEIPLHKESNPATTMERDFTKCDFDEAANDPRLQAKFNSYFNQLTVDKLKKMDARQLNILLKQIINYDHGDKLKKPLLSWFAELTEFFDCHYNTVKMMSHSQRELAIGIISKYTPNSYNADLKGYKSQLPHPIDVWNENKSIIKKLQSGEVEPSKYLTQDEMELLLTPKPPNLKLRYHFLTSICLDNTRRREWFDNWINKLEENKDALSDKEKAEISQLLKESKYLPWMSDNDFGRLIKLNANFIDIPSSMREIKPSNANNSKSEVTFIEPVSIAERTFIEPIVQYEQVVP